MARYKIILAYDGTEFSGYQRQANSRTVQSVVEHALRELGWADRSILSAGRTDAGVHACGQVIAVDLEWSHSTGQLQSAINANLPADVAIRSVTLAPEEFHPRYSARARRYCYRLFCDGTRHPLRERYAWRVWPPVSMTSLQISASYLLGIHDFAAFGTPPKKGGITIREILSAVWKEDTGDLVFEIVGNAFLYRMVRRLVSVQVEIGQERRLPEDIIHLLESRIVSPIEGLAPAKGLTLVEVIYPSESGGNEDNMD
jgi:tRNA pseudouridine38-40 synthase